MQKCNKAPKKLWASGWEPLAHVRRLLFYLFIPVCLQVVARRVLVILLGMQLMRMR